MTADFRRAIATIAALATTAACAGGNAWVRQGEGESYLVEGADIPEGSDGQAPPDEATASFVPSRPATAQGAGTEPEAVGGKLVGTFRNTYYDFPSARDHKGPATTLFDGACHAISKVPRGFHDAVCVQGSGTLKDGSTVSFAKRDCECARVCPRTKQKICFDRLDPTRFPWGRGATGRPITPLLTIAVDSDVIPLGTSVYVPEYDGLPRDEGGTSLHDGCFIAQDRGMKVKGKQIDVFTGHESLTKLWNRLMPSNRGVHVFVESPRCARADVPASPPPRRKKKKSRKGSDG